MKSVTKKEMILLLAAALFACGSSLAQSTTVEPAPAGAERTVIFQRSVPPPGAEAGAEAGVIFQRALPAPPPGQAGVAVGNVDFLWAMPGFEKPVTGAPYRAEAVTETTQVLADGNRIVNKHSASLARDSKGRTRREEIMGKVGPWQVNGPKLTFISDPASETNYILNEIDSTATVMKLGKIALAGQSAQPGQPGQKFTLPLPPPFPGHSVEETKTETLSAQTMEGVLAEGKRTIRTIPAGVMGNERPIETVSEVWFSPELQVVVFSKQSDPRFGETIYRLRDIQRAEPDAALFEVPPNYTIKTTPSPFGMGMSGGAVMSTDGPK